MRTGGVFVMPGKKGMKHYPLELKLEAMWLFYQEGKNRQEITAMLETVISTG
jgi:hypothetical protein